MHVHSLLPFVGIPLFVTLSSAAAFPHEKRDLIICDHLPTKWSHSGCFSDSTSARALSSDSWCDDGMSEEKCIEYCDQKGYPIAGVEYGRECYCGYQLGSSALQEPDSDCNMACQGNTEERCGGPARLNVFTNGDPPPSTNPGPDGWSSLGCYTDSPSSRTLTTALSLDGSSMSVSACTSACQAAGFTYAGVEYGRECYCGSEIALNGAPAQDGCNMICTGRRQEWCGGAGRINIYQSTAPKPVAGQIPKGWYSEGCYTDSVSARSLGVSISMPPGDVTVEACLTACGNLSYPLAGVEWGQECYCDTQIRNGGQPASSGCDMACRGNTAETCGGSQRLNLYTTTPPGPELLTCNQPATCTSVSYSGDACGVPGKSCGCFGKPDGTSTCTMGYYDTYSYSSGNYAYGSPCTKDADCPYGDTCIWWCDYTYCIWGPDRDTLCINTNAPKYLFARGKRQTPGPTDGFPAPIGRLFNPDAGIYTPANVSSSTNSTSN